MKRYVKIGYQRKNGFTLIELLIIVAILAILAVVVFANMGTFMHMGRVNAANSELTNVRTANQAYNNDNSTFATTSDDLDDYLDRSLKGSYSFDPSSGAITGTPSSGYDGVSWNASSGKFE